MGTMWGHIYPCGSRDHGIRLLASLRIVHACTILHLPSKGPQRPQNISCNAWGQQSTSASDIMRLVVRSVCTLIHICQNKLERDFIWLLQIYPARVVSLNTIPLYTNINNLRNFWQQRQALTESLIFSQVGTMSNRTFLNYPLAFATVISIPRLYARLQMNPKAFSVHAQSSCSKMTAWRFQSQLTEASYWA